MSRNVLILTVSKLKERTAMHDNVDSKLVEHDIKAVQDLYIEPILGTALYEKILDDIEDNTLTGVYKTLVDNYIIDTLLNYTLSEVPLGLNMQFWAKGILKKTADNTETPSLTEVMVLADKYKRRAELYAVKLKNYLLENARSSVFPEYLNPGNGRDTVHPNRAVRTIPIYLGGDSDYNCKCDK